MSRGVGLSLQFEAPLETSLSSVISFAIHV
jgi:hypothetical protein